MIHHSLTLEIGGKTVGDGQPCFVVAEIGSNHNQDFDLACRMIDAAADAGADAVKFQTFRADQHYSKHTPGFSYLENVDTHALIKSLELDRSWQPSLKQHAEARGVVFFSSPCDDDAIVGLRELDMAAYKVASFDLPDTDLIGKMAVAERPMILSTGMADWSEIQHAVNACRQAGNTQIILLQCTSLYPAPAHLTNLRAMASMRAAFHTLVGYSDHTIGEHISLAAAALGACLIEKHFTLDRTLPGPDHGFAIEPDEMREMMRKLREIEAAMGDGAKDGPRPEEQEMARKGRRSLHAARAIARGETIAMNMLTIKRPNLGISPALRSHVLGRVARVDIAADQWITWDML
jgi:sialic acid synthase SpsE